jgi:uncharacterized phiE125 gp8 family phage protein
MAYKIITAATTEPVTLAQARRHLRIVAFGTPAAHPDDADIEVMIKSAREWCEQYTGKSFAVQTIELALDDFPDNEIELPLAPIKTIVSVKYADTSAVEQTASSALYSLDDYSTPNWLLLTSDSVWPESLGSANNVKVRMTTSDSAIPAPVTSAILLIIGHLYENRQENTVIEMSALPMGVFNLLQPYRINLGV